jgi:hypothetical protein
MAEKTKITLSDKELTLVKNADWILTKQLIIQKVYELFAESIPMIQAEIMQVDLLPDHVKLSVPKIYKGENYLQLPYVILDYPRYFEKENIFAVRTMFWWANFFSVTLHLSGIYKQFAKEKLYDAGNELAQDFYIGVNGNQWEHHFEKDNFLPYTELSRQQRLELFEKNNFIKLSMKFELDQWNEMPALFNEVYKKMSNLLNCQSGERDL